MKNRLPLAVTLFLLWVASLAIQQMVLESGRKDMVLDSLINEPRLVADASSGDELVLVRTSDSEFLKEPVANPPSEGDESAPAEAGTPVEPSTPAESGAGSDGESVVGEGDGKEVREPEIASGDGKEFKEVIDPKELAPIAAGEATQGGGGGGGFGGGGGGGPANEVAAFTEVREVETEDETVINTTNSTVTTKIVTRTVPVVPVPEPGSGLIGFGVAAVILASLLSRRRPGIPV